MLANVLFAVAGIEVPILGRPFAFLSAWAQALSQRANDAYMGAMGAQSSANYANAQLIAASGTGLASDVTGGVTINELFDGPSATTLGSNFTRRSEGPGGGAFGPNGSGQAAWQKSGGQERGHWDTHLTELSGRYQVVMTLLQTAVQEDYNRVSGVPTHTMLRARISNVTDTTFVYAQIFYNSLRVGCYVAGVNTVFATVPVSWAAGDVVHFLTGTNDDDYEFIVKRNGMTIWRDVDADHVSQVDDSTFVRIGLCSWAADRGYGPWYNDSQTLPAQLEVFSAADRLPTST